MSFVLFLALLCSSPIFLGIFLFKRAERLESRFFEQLKSLGASGMGSSRLIPFGARRIRAHYDPGSRSRPSRFRLIAQVQAPGSFQIEKEGAAEFDSLFLAGQVRAIVKA